MPDCEMDSIHWKELILSISLSAADYIIEHLASSGTLLPHYATTLLHIFLTSQKPCCEERQTPICISCFESQHSSYICHSLGLSLSIIETTFPCSKKSL